MWNLNMISMLNLKLRMLIRRVMIVAIACLVWEWLRNKVITTKVDDSEKEVKL